ncbi:hypothetical protein [Methylobacterium sp. 88A]|uniref:hypothetical protein n=1 Tax=Methylobacterium sp. 88A TaxID=1131813 RepID=UPI0004757BA4|nr:hypothetical protein [Methylobacterium sp. 88A]
MPSTSIFSKRFDELDKQASDIEATKQPYATQMNSGVKVDDDLLLNWRVKVRHLLSTVCKKDSEHYQQFVKSEESSAWGGNHPRFVKLRSVFTAAKEDYEGGYLNHFRNLVQADVFGDELEQASELLSNGYATAAAVIAGVVLETAIRQLCTDNGIPTGKLDRMNADLAKAGIYNSLVQKQITAQAGVRNSAAHGKPDEFTDKDVAGLIAYTETFLAERL